MPHVGASQFTELAEVHTKMLLIHLVCGSMLIFIMARAVICSNITLFNSKHKINCIHCFSLIVKRTAFNFRFGVLLSSVGVCVDPCWLRSQAGQSSVCWTKAFAGVYRRIATAEADWQKRQKQRGIGARLKPYHHGGPHIELKPNSGKVKVEQQEI